MTKRQTNPKVDDFLSKTTEWREETKQLRRIILGCGLTEELKWGKPSYSFEGNNVAIIQGFKEYFALLFFKGALLKDARGILVKPGENSQSGRQIRFAQVREIVELEPVLKAYLKEAIAAEQAGLKVKFKEITEHKVPEELQKKLDENPALKTAFAALTPGRQRAYYLYFSAPKQSKTRTARVEKCMPQILKGRGLNEDYLDKK